MEHDQPMPPSKQYKGSVTYIDSDFKKDNCRYECEATDMANAIVNISTQFNAAHGQECGQIVYFLVERETW